MTDEEIQAQIAEQVKLAIALDGQQRRLGVGVKLAKVLVDMKAVAKTGYNNFHKYAYRQADDVCDAVRPLLGKHGLVIIPHLLTVESTERITVNDNGAEKRNWHHKGHFAMQILDGEGGGALEVSWWGESLDGQDKGTGKLVTAGLKSFLIALFQIGTDVGDLEHAEGEGGAAVQRPPAATSVAAPARQASVSQRSAGARSEGTGTDGLLSARQIKEILDKGEKELALTKQQVSWVVKQERGGNEPSGLLKKARADRYDAIIQGLEYVKAEQMKREEADLIGTETQPEMPDLEPQENGKPAECTCGAGEDAPAAEHAESCDLSIPF